MVMNVWLLLLQLHVESVPITNKVVFQSCSWQGVLDTTLCDLQQVSGFIWAFLLPPSIKLTATI